MRVTSKGQVTIAKHIRRRNATRSGTEVAFVEKDGNIVLTTQFRRGSASRSLGEGFKAYLDRVTGRTSAMTIDESMPLLRGE